LVELPRHARDIRTVEQRCDVDQREHKVRL
jgi:hypothetical protein